MCAVGHSVERSRLAKHHVSRRRNLATRWDEKIAADLCFWHHEECEKVGDVRFATKYKHRLLIHSPSTYELLMSRRKIV